MNTRIVVIVILAGIFSLNNKGNAQKQTTPVLKSGNWRGILQRPDGNQIIFNFITERKNNRQLLYVLNGTERLLVDSIIRKKDSLFIQMPFFNSGFNARIKTNGDLEGIFIKKSNDINRETPFTAKSGSRLRYISKVKPAFNISGKWAVTFDGKDESETRAVGEFNQDKNGKITGTFLTPTGDYRFLEGTVSGDSLKLSAFDGGHAVLFSAKINDVNTMEEGTLFSGLVFKQKWSAKRDSLAQLPDSYSITVMREGETKLNFRFPSTEGDTVSINDDRFKNKVVIVQIMGSWCPNCMDETAFLSNWYKMNKDRGVEILGLAYEITDNFAAAKKGLATFQNKFDVTYPFLITGVKVSDEKRTEKTLPQVEKIKGFPTTIFIGKDGKVGRISTGFNGPGTGVHYEEFKKEFENEVTRMLSQ